MRSDPPTEVLRTVGLIATLALAAACGGISVEGGHLEDDASERTPAVEFGVRLGDDGRLLLDGAVPGDARWAHLQPSNWPAELGEAPVVGVGLVVRLRDEPEFLPLAYGSSAPVDNLVGVVDDGPVPTDGAKHACAIVEVGDGRVRLACGEEHGVSAGDLYFVIDSADAGSHSRIGTRVSALLRVTEVESDRSTTRVEHARGPIEVGTIAGFAQASFDLPARSATVLVASFERGGGEPAAFPAIADALPEYMARFGLTNIGVEAYDGFLDPRPHDAPEQAAEAAEEVGADYGSVVFGDLEGDTLVFNATAFGPPPHPATTVGILPGGLPLPVDVSLEQLSRQLAPSFIATVLALRGDHALAAYLLESVLATEELEPAVRYHLREHLALRYESLGRPLEALRIISADVERAEAADDTYPVLNALSIRSHLADTAGLLDLAEEDTAAFLSVAHGVLPDESLSRERLDHARAVAANGRVEDALDLIRGVREEALEADDAELQYDVALQQAAVLFGEPDDARAALDALGPVMDRLDDDQIGLVEIFQAEFAAARGDTEAVSDHLRAALEHVADSDTVPLRASVYRSAARAFSSAGQAEEAAVVMAQALALLLDTAQLDIAATTLIELAFLDIEWFQTEAGDAAGQALQRARQNLVLGAELSLRLGYTQQATRGFLLAGLLENQLGQFQMSGVLLDRAERVALTGADYPTLHELYSSRARVAEALGEVEAGAEYQRRALLFARAAGIEIEGGSVGATGE